MTKKEVLRKIKYEMRRLGIAGRIEVCDNGDVFVHTGGAYPLHFQKLVERVEKGT